MKKTSTVTNVEGFTEVGPRDTRSTTAVSYNASVTGRPSETSSGSKYVKKSESTAQVLTEKVT